MIHLDESSMFGVCHILFSFGYIKEYNRKSTQNLKKYYLCGTSIDYLGAFTCFKRCANRC